MSEFTVDQLRDMLAAAESAAAETAAESAAVAAVTAVVTAAAESAAALVNGAAAAGATIDLAAIVAAAIERVAPVAPETLAAIVAPAPLPAPAPDAVPTDPRKKRTDPPRDWSAVPTGLIWDCSLLGRTGRVRIDVAPGARGASFLATTGERGRHGTPSRAVQSACGNPTSTAPSVLARGGSTVAPVNGWVALSTVINGTRVRLGDVAAII